MENNVYYNNYPLSYLNNTESQIVKCNKVGTIYFKII